jgi:hypothetical protein
VGNELGIRVSFKFEWVVFNYIEWVVFNHTESKFDCKPNN